MTPIVIHDEQALAEFRSTRFSVSALTPLIESNRIILANAPVGTGKSRLLDDLLDHYIAQSTFDLIVVLAALTANLLEHGWSATPRPKFAASAPDLAPTAAPLIRLGGLTSGAGRRPTRSNTYADHASTSETASGRASTGRH